MKNVAVFVDAGYFWVQVCTLLSGSYTSRGHVNIDYKALRLAVLSEVSNHFSSCDLLRVYWYDGPGNNGKTAEHVSIDQLDDFKLRLGTRNSVGSQKGVDGLIIADLISLTQQKAISHALLVTGDSDIAPGVIAAQGMGLRVHLLSIGALAATSPYLASEADSKHFWSLSEVSKFASSTPVANPTTSSACTTSPPVQVMPASPTPSVVAVDLISIAKSAHKDIGSGSHASSLLALNNSVVKIPSEIDSALLYFAKNRLGRALEEQEKKDLRTHFRKLL